MASNAEFASTAPFTSSAVCSATANIAYVTPGPTGQVTLYTAGAQGAKIDIVNVLIIGTSIDGQVLLWRHGAGYNASDILTTDYYLVDAFNISTAMAQGENFELSYAGLTLNGSEYLSITSTVASQPVQVNCSGGSF